MELYNEQSFRFPAKLWLPSYEIEAGAMQQIRNVSAHPELASSIAVMPDCHQGYGVTIGSVVETKNAVIPFAVGVDIGCGVTAIKTDLQLTDEMDKIFWRNWAGKVGREIPTGRNSHEHRVLWDGFRRHPAAFAKDDKVWDTARRQLGTLGGGNHFLEAQFDRDNTIWVMVHSGSRRIGKDIADHYHEIAVNDSTARGVELPGEGFTRAHLSSITLERQVAWDYLDDAQWARDYAEASRMLMAHKMVELLKANVAEVIDCSHNYATWDNDHVLHRKGATNASAGVLGLIPGSMGTKSYVVRGKGVADSHNSCSHGAGRAMSRGAAKRSITEQNLADSLETTYTRPSINFLDEAPGAYKDIDDVVTRQLDLIDIVTILQPLITVKGGGRDEG